MANRTPGRYGAALKHRDFRLLLTSYLIDAIGSWASTTVLTVYIFESTHSLTLLALFPSTRWVVGLLAAPVAGVIADRYDRRRVMIVSALGTGAVVAGITAVVGLHAPVLLILLLQIGAALASSPYQPAAGALTPEVVDETSLPTANSLFATAENLVIVIGPAIGGALILLRAPVVGIALNALSYFVAAGIAASLRVRSHGDAEPGENPARQFVDGIRALGATPTAAILLLFVGLDTLLAGSCTVLYIPIGQHAGLGDDGYGYLLAASALGGIVGAVLANRLSAARALAPVIVGGMLLQALPFAVTPFIHNGPAILGLQVLSGAGMVTVDVLGMTAIQREVASGSLSRVLGLLEMVYLLASVLGTFAASTLVSLAEYRAALLVLGLGTALVAVALSPLVVRSDRRSAVRTALLAERVAVLQPLELFTSISRTRLERLAAAMDPQQIAAGDVLIQEGDPADAIWVLVSGSLAVTASTRPDGGIPDVMAPDVVGEIGVLRSLPRTATVTAAADATVWRLSGEDFLGGLEPERTTALLIGTPTVRLARTHPGLVQTAGAGDA